MLKKSCEFVLLVVAVAVIVLLASWLITKNDFCISLGTFLALVDVGALKITDKLHLDLFK